MNVYSTRAHVRVRMRVRVSLCVSSLLDFGREGQPTNPLLNSRFFSLPHLSECPGHGATVNAFTSYQ